MTGHSTRWTSSACCYYTGSPSWAGSARGIEGEGVRGKEGGGGGGGKRKGEGYDMPLCAIQIAGLVILCTAYVHSM